jgi:beta-lactamase superfamily II metal-dependent hydrolase
MMKQRIIALLALLAGLLAGCIGTPEPADPVTAAPSSESAVPAASVLHIYCFQTGKADAFLLWNEDGAVLIDAGVSGYGKNILAKLEALGINRLDYLILTHFDKDHVGGAKKLLTSIPVGTVLQSNCPKPGADAYDKYAAALEETGVKAVTLRERLNFSLGDVTFEVDPPALERYDRDESNNSSLIVAVTHGDNRLLFPGDAEDLRLMEYLRTDPGLFAMVKLPHHGVWQNSLRELLAQTSPAWAVITSSDEEPEDPETLALLTEKGVQIFLTRTAPVLLTSDGTTLIVEYAP